MINLKFDENGLHIPTYNDIYEDFSSKIKEKMGSDFYLDSESPDAQYLSLLALAQADTCLVLQKIISSFYPSTAQGASLDRICSFQGIQRFIPTQSTCEVIVYGVPGTDISNMVVSDVNDELWNIEEGTISELGQTIVTAKSVNNSVYAGIGEIINIVDAPQDVTSVKNIVPCIQGKKEETDSELRLRRIKSVMQSSVGTVDSILGALINLNGVVNINVINNGEKESNEALPAYSMCVSILGGDDKQIAEVISNKKSPGCNLVGTTEVILNKNNYNETIRFYRPNYVECKIEYILTPLSNYAPEYRNKIADKVKEYIQSLKIGEYVYIGNLYQIGYSVITNNSSIPYNIKQIDLYVKQGDDFVQTQDNIPVEPYNLITLAEEGISFVDGLNDNSKKSDDNVEEDNDNS